MTAPPFKVKAVYDYNSPHDEDLRFAIGQIITVTEEEDADWYVGEYTDAAGTKRDGLFPKNFVERHEPEAPPRPSRARSKKETAAPTSPIASTAEAPPIPEPAEAPAPAPAPEPVVVQPRASPEPVASKSPPPKPEPTKAAPATKGPPPPVAEKPSSFKDRIAAFNKAAAAPIAPVKPGGAPSSSTGFIKKPFVAPPPSRDAFVPRPREQAPSNVYRREEDPEIARQQAQDLEDAERAGLVAHKEDVAGEEEVPRATSLKDRIALLQKQQQEQAARHAELAQKEKRQRPTKKRTESSEHVVMPGEEEVEFAQTTAAEPAGRPSTEAARDVPRPPSRKMSQGPTSPGPSRESLSDGNDADQSGAGDTTEDAEGASTEVEEDDVKTPAEPPKPLPRTATGSSSRQVVAEPAVYEEDEEEDKEEEEEEDEMDAETRRKMELRERMAKMSGGMGMPGMFGAMPMPSAAPRKKRPSGASDSRSALEAEATSPPAPQRVPMVPVPGVQRTSTAASESTEVAVEREPEPGPPITAQRPPEEVPDVEDLEQQPAQPMPSQNRAVPPVPQDRPLPPPPTSPRAVPPVPGQRSLPAPPGGRPVPPPPPGAPPSATADTEPGEEVSAFREQEMRARGLPPLVPSAAPAVPQRPDGPRSPHATSAKRSSYLAESGPVPTSPSEKQPGRAPAAPVPTMPPPAEARPPPPPPPTAAPPSRRSLEGDEEYSDGDDEGPDRESDYEGDYDTDIGSGVPHRDALKAHERQVSMDEETLSGDKALQSPKNVPPPVPTETQRAPPPPPPQQATVSRRSTEAPRAPPPVPQPPRTQDVQDYDPYRYSEEAPTFTQTSPIIPESPIQESDPALYAASPPRPAERAPPPPPQSPPTQHRAPPPVPPHEELAMPAGTAQPQSLDLPRQSADTSRLSMNASRLSSEQQRPYGDQGYIARDINLEPGSQWWALQNMPPPMFQNRNDLLCEFEESSTSKRGGRTSISKDVYVLFQDYSQTIISARFDSTNVADAAIEQRHEPPPGRLRQDQLEAAHSQYGGQILAAASSKQNQTVGDGTAQAFIFELLRAQPNALLPVGTRAYGALVYANMGNATVQQLDEIRAGDVISFRNARFQGKHGAMHAKYSEDVGKPEHVGVIAEWDGTKKKVRVLDQGRDGKKVKVESFRLGDLRSGEVKVWRVMGRSWVGWESGA